MSDLVAVSVEVEPKKPLIQVGMAIYESLGLRKIKSIPPGPGEISGNVML